MTRVKEYHFVCAVCQEDCVSDRSDEDVAAEFAVDFPGCENDERVIVCDDCYKIIMLDEKTATRQ